MFPLEWIFDLIFDCWFSVMQWIVPKRTYGRTARILLKTLVVVFSCALLFLMLIGIFALISASASRDPFVRQIGRYLVFVPLAISGVQILLGIIVRRITKNR